MKRIVFIFAAAALSCTAADSLLKPLNDLEYGTWAARVQALSMVRDYENNAPTNSAKSPVRSKPSP